MAAAAADPQPPVDVVEEREEDYESDEYDVEDDGEDAEYNEEEEEDDAEQDGQREKSLTAFLIPGNADEEEEGEEEEDDAYVPGNGVELAEQEVDGYAHPEKNGAAPPPQAAPLKRKTSGDEDAEEEEHSLESDAKKVKV